jgi:hypothetical protein
MNHQMVVKHYIVENLVNTEIAHDSYYDGWTLNGMKQERDWLLSELRRLDSENNQLELFPPTNDA